MVLSKGNHIRKTWKRETGEQENERKEMFSEFINLKN